MGDRAERREAADAAFDALFRREFPRLAGALRLVASDAAVAEEVAQEAFVRAYQAWDRVQGLDRPAGWLYTTAFNLLRRRWRIAQRPAPGQQATPTDGTASVADRLDLEGAIRSLPESQRRVVVLRYVLGMSTDEAADVVGCSPGALRATLHRAVVTLRLEPALAVEGEDR